MVLGMFYNIMALKTIDTLFQGVNTHNPTFIHYTILMVNSCDKTSLYINLLFRQPRIKTS